MEAGAEQPSHAAPRAFLAPPSPPLRPYNLGGVGNAKRLTIYRLPSTISTLSDRSRSHSFSINSFGRCTTQADVGTEGRCLNTHEPPSTDGTGLMVVAWPSCAPQPSDSGRAGSLLSHFGLKSCLTVSEVSDTIGISSISSSK